MSRNKARGGCTHRENFYKAFYGDYSIEFSMLHNSDMIRNLVLKKKKRLTLLEVKLDSWELNELCVAIPHLVVEMRRLAKINNEEGKDDEANR
jgi:hypothetical protein